MENKLYTVIETNCYKYNIVLQSDEEEWLDIYKINPLMDNCCDLIKTNRIYKDISNNGINQIKEFLLIREDRLKRKNNDFLFIFRDFNTLIENILNGSNTWIKSKKSFLLNGYGDYSDLGIEDVSARVHVPFKLTFEEFTITNLNFLNIDFTLNVEQRKILLKAFMTTTNIVPSFLTRELKTELDNIDLSLYCSEIKRIHKKGNAHNFINGFDVSDNKSDLFKEIENKDYLKSSVGEKVGLDEYSISIENISFEEKFINTVDNNLCFRFKPVKVKKDKSVIESLVLWDIENVNFFNDVSKITSKLKSDNQLKVVSYYRKNKSDNHTFYSGNIYIKLHRLKKNNWVIKTSKISADNVLIDDYNKYRDNLKELILISSDSDFLPIVLNAISLGIRVKIYNNSNFKTKKWFDDFDYEKIS